MASFTRIGCIVIIAVVAGCTIIGNRNMCPIQDPEIIVVGELGRTPAGLGRMALGAIRSEVE